MPVAQLAGLLILCCAGRVQSQETDIRMPFPEFAPRPSATVVFCRATMGASVHAHDAGNASGKYEAAHIGAKTFKFDKDGMVNGSAHFVRLTFSGTRLLVSQRLSLGNSEKTYTQDFPYKVLNDDPGNFVALWDRTAEAGSLQIISLDRETGTMVFTTTYASLPDRGHPFTTADFFVCQERDW
jgi:hypothetical protein